jgi:type IV pilus assembly protein PilN
MIRINLIAGEREKPKKKAAVPFDIGQKVTLVCSLILVVAALGIGWWWWALDREQARIATETADAQRETARLQSILVQVGTFDKQKQQLLRRVALIEELKKGQSGGVHMLDELSRALPDMLWLTQVKQDGGELTIEGRCTTITALSDLVANLEQSRYFRKPVEIIDSRVEAVQAPAPELIKFTLKATFAIPGMQPAPKAGR